MSIIEKRNFKTGDGVEVTKATARAKDLIAHLHYKKPPKNMEDSMNRWNRYIKLLSPFVPDQLVHYKLYNDIIRDFGSIDQQVHQ